MTFTSHQGEITNVSGRRKNCPNISTWAKGRLQKCLHPWVDTGITDEDMGSNGASKSKKSRAGVLPNTKKAKASSWGWISRTSKCCKRGEEIISLAVTRSLLLLRAERFRGVKGIEIRIQRIKNEDDTLSSNCTRVQPHTYAYTHGSVSFCFTIISLGLKPMYRT